MIAGLGVAGTGRAARPFLALLQSAGLGPRPAAELGSSLGVLLLVPADIGECEALLFETDAFAKAYARLETIVIAGTLSPRYVRALRGRIAPSVALIDAPFSGSQRACEQGRVSFFVGGRKDDIHRVAPVFDRLGRQRVRMGGFGTAMAAKVMNDFLAASASTMTRVALDWAEAQGIDEERLLDMAGTTLGTMAAAHVDPADHAGVGPNGDESMTSLVRDVEIALDNALAGAHLTPPRALEDVFRGLKPRHLH